MDAGDAAKSSAPRPRHLAAVPELGPRDAPAAKPYDLSQASPDALRRLYVALLDGFSDEERARLEALIDDNVARLRDGGDNFTG